PVREPLRPVDVGSEALAGRAAGDDTRADYEVRLQITGEERDSVMRQLDSAIGALPSEDQVILRLRFWEGLSVAEISRALRVDQKPLYRRLDKLIQDLRARLEQSGVSAGSLAFMSEMQEVG